MNYNLSIITPKNWPHYACLNEVVLYFYHMLKKRCNIEINFNKFYEKGINIIFFAFNIPIDFKVPKNSIIFQSEDLSNGPEWILKNDSIHYRGQAYFDLINQFPIIDYSKLNLDQVANNNKVFLPLLYCEDLKFKFDICDKNYLLFYGSLTNYRSSFLKKIQKYKIINIPTSFGSWGYGMYRDKLISEATAILNIHKSSEVKHLETVRVFYNLINDIPVITEKFNEEKDDYYKNCVFTLQDLSEESIDNIMSKLTCAKERKKKQDIFKSFNAKKIFNDCLDKLKI